MTCKFCNSELDEHYCCVICDITFNRNDGINPSYLQDKVIEGILYSATYFASLNKTTLYKGDQIIYNFDGEINFNDLFKRVKVITVFS